MIQAILKGLFALCFCLSITQCQRITAPDAGIVKLMKPTGEQVASDTDLEYIGWGIGQLIDIDRVSPPEGVGTIWALSLVSHEKLTLDKARVKILTVFDDYKALTLGNPEFVQAGLIYAEQGSDLPINENKIGIRLAFWDENVDRPWPPYVAQVRVGEGIIKYYYVADETQRLNEDPYIETVAEARLKVQRN